MADYTAEHGIRARSCLQWQIDHGTRTQALAAFYSDHGVQCASGILVADHGVRAANDQSLTSDHGVQCRALPPEFVAAFFPPSQGGSMRKLLNKSGNGNYGNKLTFRGPGGTKDFTPYLVSWQGSRQTNQAARYTLTLADPERRFRPFGGAFSEDLNCENYEGENLAKWLELEVLVAGVRKKRPHLVPLQGNWTLSPTGSQFVLTCTDFTDLLLQSNKDIGEFKNTSASSVVAAILSACGVTHYRLKFRDYRVSKFTAKGQKPLDYISKLLWVVQAEWFWDGDTFIAQDRKTRPGGADWTCMDNLHVTGVNYRVDNTGLKNRQYIRKIVPSPGLLAEYECVGGQCIGFNTIQFNQPAQVAHYVVEDVVNGVIELPVWMDGNGNPIGSTSPVLVHGGKPAESLRVVYRPRIDNVIGSAQQTGWTPRVKINVYGSPFHAEPGEDGSFDTGYDVEVNDPNQSRFRVKPADGVIEDQMIPDAATAQFLGERLNEESERMTKTMDIEGPLHPLLMPGYVIEVIVRYGGISHFFHTEGIQEAGTANSATMTVNLSLFPGQ